MVHNLVRILRFSEVWKSNSADIWGFNLNITITQIVGSMSEPCYVRVTRNSRCP